MSNVGASYWICSAPRSGSTWLCDSLALAGVAGRPGEHFSASATPVEGGPQEELGALNGLLGEVHRKGSGANGVVGTKVLWSQCVPLLARMRKALGRNGLADAQVLDAFLPGLRFVWLRRADKLRQAISLSRAVESRVWWRRDAEAPAAGMAQPPDLMSDEQELRQWVQRIDVYRAMLQRDDEGWRAFFRSALLTPLVLDYEQLVHGHGRVVQELLHWLGFPQAAPSASSSLVKQGDLRSEELVHAYLTARRQYDPPRVDAYAGLMPRDA